MKPAAIFLGFLIIIGGLWWYFGGSPRSGPTEGIFVERSDQFTDPQSSPDLTNNVRLFGFRLINATSSDIAATSSIFMLEPYSTFGYSNVKNIQLSYNNNVIAVLPGLDNPITSIHFNRIILPRGSSGQFWLSANLTGSSTATTTLGFRLIHIDAGSAGPTPRDLPVYRKVNNLELTNLNYEPSVKWIIIPPSGGR